MTTSYIDSALQLKVNYTTTEPALTTEDIVGQFQDHVFLIQILKLNSMYYIWVSDLENKMNNLYISMITQIVRPKLELVN